MAHVPLNDNYNMNNPSNNFETRLDDEVFVEKILQITLMKILRIQRLFFYMITFYL